MKQSEKLDLILRGLYEHMNDGQYWSITEILKPLGIQLNFEELWRLTHRLYEDNYIHQPISNVKDVLCKINSYGIEYCEEDSYTYTGHSIITNTYNISITDSPNATIVSNSQNVSISINNYAEVKNKITELRNAVQSNPGIDQLKKQEIIECIDEVEANVDNGRVPKYTMRSLLSLTSDIAGLASIGLELAKLFGII
jgi:hypothetical protein